MHVARRIARPNIAPAPSSSSQMSANLGRQRSRTRLLALLRLLSAAIALLRLSAPSSCHVAHAATFADSAAAAAGRPIAVVNARPFHSEVLSGAMAALAPVADRVAVYMDHYVFKVCLEGTGMCNSTNFFPSRSQGR